MSRVKKPQSCLEDLDFAVLGDFLKKVSFIWCFCISLYFFFQRCFSRELKIVFFEDVFSRYFSRLSSSFF